MFQRTRNLAVTRGVLNAVNSNACAKFIGSRVPDVFIRLAHVPPQIRALEEIGAALEQRVKPEGRDTFSRSLPALPPCVTTYPFTPWLTKEEIEKYVPHFRTMKWETHMITHYIRPSKATSRSIGTPCLSRRFRLNTKDDGEAFLQDMLKISREENHELATYSCFRRARAYGLTFVVKLQTYYATPGKFWGNYDGRAATIPYPIPCITLRDIRLTIRLEHLFRKYVRDGRAGRLHPGENVVGNHSSITPVQRMNEHLQNLGVYVDMAEPKLGKPR